MLRGWECSGAHGREGTSSFLLSHGDLRNRLYFLFGKNKTLISELRKMSKHIWLLKYKRWRRDGLESNLYIKPADRRFPPGQSWGPWKIPAPTDLRGHWPLSTPPSLVQAPGNDLTRIEGLGKWLHIFLLVFGFYLSLATLGLSCCTVFSLVAAFGGCTPAAVEGLSLWVVSLVEHGVLGSGAWY